MKPNARAGFSLAASSLFGFFLSGCASLGGDMQNSNNPYRHFDEQKVIKDIEGGADPNSKVKGGGEDGMPVLLSALHNKHWRIASALIDHGADLGGALDAAVCNVEIGKKLIDKGADANGIGDDVPLFLWNVYDGPDFDPKLADDCLLYVKLLVEHGADVNKVSPKAGDTPIFHAKDARSAEYLISKGADVNRRRRDGGTPLQIHTFGGQRFIPVLAALLKAGADVNAEDRSGYTPLTQAVYNEYVNNVKWVENYRQVVNFLRAMGGRASAKVSEEKAAKVGAELAGRLEMYAAQEKQRLADEEAWMKFHSASATLGCPAGQAACIDTCCAAPNGTCCVVQTGGKTAGYCSNTPSCN